MKYMIFLFLCFSFSQALNISEKFPSYNYVFDEFDVDKSYIDNAEFVDFVIRNEKSMRSFYEHSLERGKMLLPMMKGMLVGEGVSDLFIYLSMVESGFSLNAVSPKKAVGLWQFMPATAKQYHLTVCESNDERCDATSSTSAAILYLNKLHRQFGKWYLAAMAYNCGEGCVQRAIEKAGNDDLALLIDDNLNYLPIETRLYIKKILLIAMIGENNILDFSRETKQANKHLTEVKVNRDVDLRKVAKALKMSYSMLENMNSSIINGKVQINKEDIKIRIPTDKIFAFYLRYELIDNPKPIKEQLISHYVKLGETLESIAKRYHTTADEIKIVNHLKENYLSVDQFLAIPVDKDTFEKVLMGTSK